jgi:hypothetical protein
MTFEQEAAAFLAGRQVYRRGNTLRAIPRPQGLADRIASWTHRGMASNWPAADRCAGRARVCHNAR